MPFEDWTNSLAVIVMLGAVVMLCLCGWFARRWFAF
jgi:hypothetical protein